MPVLTRQQAALIPGLSQTGSAVRSGAGRRAYRGGAIFERDLDRAHQVYARLGVARIDRLPVPTSPLSDNALSPLGLARHRGRARTLSRRQGYDYVGYFGRRAGPGDEPGRFAGLAIAMEAKSTTRALSSLPITGGVSSGGLERTGTGVMAHQLEAMAAAMAFGAVPALVWRGGDPDDRGCFRGVLLGDAITAALAAYSRRERLSIPRERFTPYRAAPCAGFREGIEDWLQVVREWMVRRDE